MLFFLIQLGDLPPVGSVQGVRTLGLSDSVTTPPLPAPDDCVTIGAGLPPVPAKLVSRKEAGEYIDMTELLPGRLGITRSPANEDSVRAVCQQRRALSGILEWIQCSATYVHCSMLLESSSLYSRFARLSNSDHRSFFRVPRRWLVRIRSAVPAKSCS